MKFKTTIPYILTTAAFVMSASSYTGIGDTTNDNAKRTLVWETRMRPTAPVLDSVAREYQERLDDFQLNKKANTLVDKYVGNMLTAQEKLNPLLGTRKYRAAVRQELPGAPVGLHCVYGQYTQLNRALHDMGDTLTIVPQDASRACIMFKSHMRQEYSAPEYDGAIREGRMFESDSAYNVALNRYMARNHVTENTDDSVQAAITARFARNNFSADQLTPGTMLVVPRYRGSRSKFHMIMLLGRGRVQDGKFVPDTNGRYMYTGHNRETIGDLFKAWDATNVFAADTRKIARAKYAAEWQRIESMTDTELSQFLAIQPHATNISHNELMSMARNRYFGDAPQVQNTITMNQAIRQMRQRTM